MSDPMVRTIGEVFDLDMHCVKVGVDYDSVSIDLGVCQVRFTPGGTEEFAQLFVSAVWQAGQQKAAMDAEASHG